MRIAPIEKPTTWKMRLAYWYAKRMFGKVITPMKVVYNRFPPALDVSRALHTGAESTTIDPVLRVLVTSHVAAINGCGFCLDLGELWALHTPGAHAKWRALPDFESDPLFTEAERAALRFAAESTQSKRCSDENWKALQRFFNDEEIVQISWLTAMETYYNVMNGPLQIESDGLCAVPRRKTEARTAAEVH